MTSTVLFLHGRRTDDPEARWREALEAALSRGKYGTLSDRELTTINPSWLYVLEGPDPPEDDEPSETFVQAKDEEHTRAVGRYLRHLSSLESSVSAASRSGPGHLAGVAADQLAEAWIKQVMNDVYRYCSSTALRQACLRRVLECLPPEGEVVVIGHSLGSALPVDLLYVLPPPLRGSLFFSIEIG